MSNAASDMTHYALFLGINQFPEDRNIPELQFAHNDVRSLHDLFQGPMRYGDRAELLLQPNASQIWAALRRFGQRVRAGDVFTLYIAGHGVQHGTDQFVLLPGAVLRRVRAGIQGQDILSLEGVIDEVLQWPDAQCLLMLDMCRRPLVPGDKAGAMPSFDAQVQAVLRGLAGRDLAPRYAAESMGTAPEPVQPNRQHGRITIVNACSDGERAFEVESLERGLFSLAFEAQLQVAVNDRRHWMVTPDSGDELAAEVGRIAALHALPICQRPWLSPVHSAVVVFKPSQNLQVLREEVAQPADQAAGAARAVAPAVSDLRQLEPPNAADASALPQDWQKLSEEGKAEEAVPIIRQRVALGDLEAINQMAGFLHYGHQPGVDKDLDEAQRLWRTAIDMGNPQAMSSVSQVLRASTPSARELAEARRLSCRAASLGDLVGCMDACTDWTRDGQERLATQDQLQSWLDAAVSRLLPSDSRWLSVAVFALHGPQVWRTPSIVEDFLSVWAGTRVPDPWTWDEESSIGTRRHLTLAFAVHVLLTRSRSNTDDALQRARAICNELRKQSDGQQPDRALAHFAWSAGHGVNGFEKDPGLSLQLLREGESLGGGRSLFELYQWHRHCGALHLADRDDALKDDQLASQYLVEAAELGFPDALVAMAVAYANGRGPAPAADFVKARSLAEQALAHELTPELLHDLGGLFRNGEGALADDALGASIWYRCLHHQAGQEFYNAPEAMLSFALLLWFGKGVRPDKRDAAAWLEKSVVAVRSRSFLNTANYVAEQERDIGLALAGVGEHGFQHRHGSDPEGAVGWIERAAEHGDAKARALFVWSYGEKFEQKFSHAHYTYPDCGLRWPIEQADRQITALFREGSQDAAVALRWRLEFGGLADAALAADVYEALYAAASGDDCLTLAESAQRYFSQTNATVSELEVRANWSKRVGLEKAAQATKARDAAQAEASKSTFERAIAEAGRSGEKTDEQARRAFQLMKAAAEEQGASIEVPVRLATWTLIGFGTSAAPNTAIDMFDRCLDRAHAAKTLKEAAESISSALLDQYGDIDEAGEFNRESLSRLVGRLASEGTFSGLACLGILQAEGICGLARDESKAASAFDKLFQVDAQEAKSFLATFLDASRYGWRRGVLLRSRRYTSYLQRVAAEALYRNAGDPVKGDAAYCLAQMYGDGMVVAYPLPGRIQQLEPDVEAEAQWRIRAADAGHLPSLKRLAAAWLKSPEIDGHVAGAWLLLSRAAQNGDLECSVLLGDLLLDHPGAATGVSALEARPEYWFDKAVGQSEGWSLSIAQAVFRPRDPGRVALSQRWLQRALDKCPSSSAWFTLAARHAHGNGVALVLDEADRCLERGLAVGPSDRAKHLLESAARLWMDGTLPNNPVRAVAWLRRAAELGAVEPMWQLGDIYASGWAGKPDRALAEQYFRRSIADGNRYEGMEGLTYWWTRWGAVEHAAEAASFEDEWKCDDQESETSALMTLLRLRLKMMASPEKLSADSGARVGYWASGMRATSDYRLSVEQALYAMREPLLPERLDRARRLLKEALELVRDRPYFRPISVERETAYIESVQARLSTLTPRHWVVRLFKGQL